MKYTLIAAVVGVAVVLTGCTAPNLNDPIPAYSKSQTYSACVQLKSPFYGEVRKQRAEQYLRMRVGFQQYELDLIRNKSIRIGMNIQAALCSWPAKLVNHSAGSSYSRKQYRTYDTKNPAYLYERNNSGRLDSFSK